MNVLKINTKIKEYPYEKTHSSDIIWGEIRVTINNDQNEILKDLYVWEWDVKQMFDWLMSNKKYILNEKLSMQVFLSQPNSSIAKTIFDFYRLVDENDDDMSNEQMLEYLYEYKIRHNFRGSLVGARVRPDFYLGRNHNTYEVSHFSETDSWCYEIDLISFYNELENRYYQIVSSN